MIDQRPWHRIVTRGNAGREVSGDLYLLDWLEHEGIEYDTITDHDLHAEGADLLRPYAGIVTGGHPEYISEEMLDALGATSTTAATSPISAERLLLGHDRRRRRAAPAGGAPRPQRIKDLDRRAGRGPPLQPASPAATGSTGAGRRRHSSASVSARRAAVRAPGYDRTPESHDPRAAFIFDGIGDDEVIGDFGLKLGGAAADELDRADFVARHAAGDARGRQHPRQAR